MAIRTGIGVGGAQIFDTSGIIDTYGRQIAQQQKAQALQAEKQAKEQAKFDEDLADLIAGVKTEGARDIDIPSIKNKYNSIKDFYANSAKIKESDKPLFRAELRNKINSLNEFAQRSNKLSKDYGSVLSDIAKNEWDYDPSSVSEIRKIAETPLENLGGMSVIDPMKYKRLPNFGLIDNIIDKTYKAGKDLTEYKGEIKKQGKRFDIKSVKPEVINNLLVQGINSNPEARQALNKLYVQTTGDTQPTAQKITDFLNKQYQTKYKYEYEGEPKDLKEPKGSGLTKTEQKTLEEENERKVNVRNLIDNKSQDVFDLIKSNLPAGSSMNWINTKDKGTIGVKIKIPKSRDEEGNIIGGIEQLIDFTKGNPYAAVNKVLNIYTGKKVRGEKFLNEKQKPQPKPDTQSKGKKATKGVYAGLDKDGNPIFK